MREEACDRAGVPAGSIVCGASFRCFLVLATFWPEPKNLLDTGVGLFARIFNLFRRFPLSATPRGLRYPLLLIGVRVIEVFTGCAMGYENYVGKQRLPYALYYCYTKTVIAEKTLNLYYLYVP